ncbi:MAG: hypothetical protein J7M09_05105 [Deltaproteobacteria bacterium]|nr:hypothetical protein [Candidatus Tharpella sp.]
MSIKRFNYFCLPTLFFLLLSLILVVLIQQNSSRKQALELVAAEIVRADAENNHEKAIKQYQELGRDNDPLIEVRIMRRRWLLALSIFQHKQPSEGMGSSPDDYLFALQQSGEALLNQKLSLGIVWRIHNLLGAGFLLQALAMLEKEQNLQRSKALLNLAIGHFKQAITWIDRDPVARSMSNIPRWNLELLSTIQNLSGPNQNRAPDNSKLDLQKNLATMLPESAGYMVGEPPDSRIRK